MYIYIYTYIYICIHVMVISIELLTNNPAEICDQPCLPVLKPGSAGLGSRDALEEALGSLPFSWAPNRPKQGCYLHTLGPNVNITYAPLGFGHRYRSAACCWRLHHYSLVVECFG